MNKINGWTYYKIVLNTVFVIRIIKDNLVKNINL